MTRTRKLYQRIATCVQAMENCRASGNSEWLDRHQETAEKMVKLFMPSGSGFDNGTRLDFDMSGPNKLVFQTGFHHMNDAGMYDGWTDHSVVVTPDLANGFVLKIFGRDRQGIKEYIAEMFHSALGTDVTDEIEAKIVGA